MKDRFRSALIRMAALAVTAPAIPLSASAACESCFGAAVDSQVTRGIGLAMLLLLLVVTAVFAGIVWFFKNTADRSRRLREGSLVIPTPPPVIPPAALN